MKFCLYIILFVTLMMPLSVFAETDSPKEDDGSKKKEASISGFFRARVI